MTDTGLALFWGAGMTLYHETGERGNDQDIIFNRYSKQKWSFNSIVTEINMFLQYLLLF